MKREVLQVLAKVANSAAKRADGVSKHPKYENYPCHRYL